MIEPPKVAKISFCTTCKGRLWQLKHTMPPNLAAVEADGCSEMVLVNYNSQDGLGDWIGQFRSAIEAGTLRYVHERSEPNFHMSKAKNLAHLAATGEFVVNLDGDNFIGDMIARYRRIWTDNPDTIIHGFSGMWRDGSCGRIGMAKRHFLALGGYDEEMLPVGAEDLDLIHRAKAYGFDLIRLPDRVTPPIQNYFGEKTPFAGTDLPRQAMKGINRARSEESIRIGRLIANRERKPRSVRINFSTELEI